MRDRSVCAHRPEACGFFTPCKPPCACGQEVREEQANENQEDPA